MTHETIPSGQVEDAPQASSGKATVSLVCGLLGLVCVLPGIGPLVAVIMGHLALREIRCADGRLAGQQKAVAGLITGYAGFLSTGLAIVVGLLLLLLGKPNGKARIVHDAGKLKQIGLAVLMYSDDCDGQLPNDLGQLVDGKYMPLGKIWVCPNTKTTPPTSSAEIRNSSHCDYVYLGKGLMDDNAKAQQVVIAYTKPGSFPRMINCLFIDGHVEGFAASSTEELAATFANRVLLPVPPRDGAVAVVQSERKPTPAAGNVGVSAPAGKAPGAPPVTAAASPPAPTPPPAEHKAADEPPMTVRWVSKKLPMPILAVIPALGGTRLAVSMKELSKVAVLHLEDGATADYITLANPKVLMGAGGNKLMLYYPTTFDVEVWDLTTCEKVRTVHVREQVLITMLTMGLANERYAFISYGREAGDLSPRSYSLLDLETGEILPIASTIKYYSPPKMNRFSHISYRDSVHFTADSALAHVTGWESTFSPSGVEYTELDLAGRTFTNYYEHKSLGSLTLSGDGSLVFSTGGYLFSSPLHQLKSYPKSMLFPVADADLFIHVSGTTYTVREDKSLSEVYTGVLPVAPTTASLYFENWQQLFATRKLNRIAVVDFARNIIHVHELMPMVTGGGAGGDGLSTRRGDTWTYKVAVPAGVSASLETGPAGCVLTGDTLTWHVPTDAESGVVDVILRFAGAGKGESFKPLKLRVE